MYLSFSENRVFLRNSADPDEIPTFETLHLCLISNEQESKHPTYFRLIFYVFKQLLRDCSGGQASWSRQN